MSTECTMIWTWEVGKVWRSRPELFIRDWLNPYHARHVENSEYIIDKIVFDTSEDMLAFKLKFGL